MHLPQRCTMTPTSSNDGGSKHSKKYAAFTVSADTARRFRGPVSQRGAGEEAWSVRQVTGVTAVLQYCSHRERAPVRIRQISRAMLDGRGPYTPFTKRKQSKIQLMAFMETFMETMLQSGPRVSCYCRGWTLILDNDASLTSRRVAFV